MKSRPHIKEIAREAIRQQRGTSIGLLLMPILVGFAVALFIAIPFIRWFGWIITLAGECIVIVLSVGISGAFAMMYRGVRVNIGDPFTNAGTNFLRKLGGMLWMSLFVFLWSLLLWIPGIVKAYAYSMTPFILAEYPEVTATDALKLSMRMTYGYKGELFLLDLSFFGWMILSAMTFTILGFVYVFPYYYTARGGFYTELRDNALAEGRIRPEELSGGQHAHY